MTPAIKAMQEWLKTCPLIDTMIEDGGIVRVAYLSTEPVELSIEDSPSDPVVEKYFSGAEKVKNYMISSRMEYSPDITQQAENSGFWDDLIEWIDAQNWKRNFPVLGEPRQPRKVVVTSTGYITNTKGSDCRYAMQLALYYYQPYVG